MIKELEIKTIKNNNNYISECIVEDTDTKELFYVVSQLGDGNDLFYGTYKASYIDFVLGKTSSKPELVEGENYMWFDTFNENSELTRFNAQYNKTFKEADKLLSIEYIEEKYKDIKPALNNIDYEIVYKKDIATFACGPAGGVYEICFLIKPSNQKLYASFDINFNVYSIYDQSIIDILEANKDNDEDEIDFPDAIEEYMEFEETEESEYYDLFLELEKYLDNYDEYVK